MLLPRSGSTSKTTDASRTIATVAIGGSEAKNRRRNRRSLPRKGSFVVTFESRSFHDATGSRHVSPMAEDFHALFGLGADARHLAPSDVAGVALAAAKELAVQNTELRAENEVLNARLAALETAVAALQQAAE